MLSTTSTASCFMFSPSQFKLLPGALTTYNPGEDSIAVSVFVVILVEFDKYWIWDKQACLSWSGFDLKHHSLFRVRFLQFREGSRAPRTALKAQLFMILVNTGRLHNTHGAFHYDPPMSLWFFLVVCVRYQIIFFYSSEPVWIRDTKLVLFDAIVFTTKSFSDDSNPQFFPAFRSEVLSLG